MSAAADVQALLARLGSSARRLGSEQEEQSASSASRSLALSWPGLNDVLPDGGLPRGIVELSSPRALGGATSLALAAVRAGQHRTPEAWCAWIDPEGTLHAPGVAASGVDLARMLVVRPPRTRFRPVVVKVVQAGAFEVIVVDYDAAFASTSTLQASSAPRSEGRSAWAPEVLVRKLALLAEPTGATVLLLTDSARPRAVPWPVALRLELSRPSWNELAVRVAKDRRGRVGPVKTVPFQPCLGSLSRLGTSSVAG